MKMNSFINRLFAAGICLAFLISSVNAEKIRFYHNDLLGSPIVMTDMDGEVVWAGDYKPFGSEIPVGTYAEKPETSYLGKEKVGDVGLNYLMARWYDPTSMRFLSQDPVDVMASNPKMFNRYVYAGNSPYTYEDPNGDVLDTIADVGFILYDVGALVYDEVANSGKNRTTNLLALGADAGAVFVPFASGGGLAVRAGRATDNAVDVAVDASKAFKKHSVSVDKLVDELTYAKRVDVQLEIPGGVAGAIRHTKQTGERVGGSDHIQKGRDILGKLKKVRNRINNSHSMSDSERSTLLNTVNHHIDDLVDALEWTNRR